MIDAAIRAESSGAFLIDIIWVASKKNCQERRRKCPIKRTRTCSINRQKGFKSHINP